MGAALVRAVGAPPIYAQIASTVRDRIMAADLLPGDQLDSEASLAEQYGVSRVTVARALEVLAREGLLVRRQGSGTFVARPPLARPLSELTGFSEHVRGLGLAAGQRLLDFTRTVVEPATEDSLLAALPVGTTVVVVRRLRTVDGAPAALHRTAVPRALADRIGLDERAMAAPDASFYGLCAAAGVELATADEQLRACNATSEQASLLGIDPRDAVLHVRRITRAASGELVEAVDAHYVGALYDYRVGLSRGSSARSHREDRETREDQ